MRRAAIGVICALLAMNALADGGERGACGCRGAPPVALSLAMLDAEGDCGQLDADGHPDFLPLACGRLYLGGAGVGLPLPWRLRAGIGVFDVRCSGTALTLLSTAPAESGASGTCTRAGCPLGPPMPVPNGRHGEAATSACVVTTTSEDLSGTADCSTGSMTISMALVAETFVEGDLLPYRCNGGAAAGKRCSTEADCGADGSCVNDIGRCRAGPTPGAPCVVDDDCGSDGTCESGQCAGGRTAGAGCIGDADCGGAATCETLVQPCPICNRATRTCDGGARDGLPCEVVSADSSAVGSTSLDCPPGPQHRRGSVLLRGTLTTGATARTAKDLDDQANVFCGFCRNKVTNRFSDPAVPCSSNLDCARLRGFTSCGQRTAGAFTPLDVARTIVMRGTAAGALDEVAAKPLILAGTLCVPPSSSLSADLAADVPGPAAISLRLLVQLR